ncbi:MAG: sigma-70 family RNA polymerase sigma factor [Candidatus Hydrogenedentota bacterium]
MVLVNEERDIDQLLVEQCQGGDIAAFDDLVLRYKDRIYNVVYRFVGHHEDAQDVVQEVFMRAYRGIQDFQGRSQVYTWLYSIASNLARNALRDGGRKGRGQGLSLNRLEEDAPTMAQQATRVDATPDRIAEQHELNDVLQECILLLPEHYRMVFVLRTFDQLSYDEIAEALGCPSGTVKSRLNQARALLRDALRERSVV